MHLWSRAGLQNGLLPPKCRVRDAWVQNNLMEGEQPEVIVNVGSHKFGRKGEIILHSELRELGRRLKSEVLFQISCINNFFPILEILGDEH